MRLIVLFEFILDFVLKILSLQELIFAQLVLQFYSLLDWESDNDYGEGRILDIFMEWYRFFRFMCIISFMKLILSSIFMLFFISKNK